MGKAEIDGYAALFLSFNRSVSVPVSALTRLVLPWSMWPAVPMM